MTMLAPILERIKASRERAKLSIVLPAKARTFKRRQYQHEDIEWLIEQKRGILAHAPGLGKTFQACEAAELPMIVSCPTNLVGQWAEFIQDQYPAWKVVVAAYGDFIKRDKAMRQPFDVLIVNHDMYSRFYMPNCSTLVVDEFHHFRHRETQRSKGLREHAKRTPRLYGLTATPVFKDVGDLWHQLHLLDPVKWRYYNPFIEQFAYTTNQGWGNKVIKIRNEPLLKQQLKPYVRERTYKEVGMFLPDRIDKDVILTLDPDFKKNVYDKLRDFYRLELEGQDEPTRFTNAGAVLHALRKLLVTDEKLAAVKEIVLDVPDSDPVIVFCWYRDTAAKVAETCDGIEITGADTPAERRNLALTGGPQRKQVRVATMASLSEGVDLSAARTVIFIEESYVPGQNYQAMTRVQRFSTTGDQRPVVAYWVRYKGTVDEVVHTTSRSRVSGNAMQVLREALDMV